MQEPASTKPELQLSSPAEKLARGNSLHTATNIPDEKRAAIEEQLRAGIGIIRIATNVGSSTNTVVAVRDQLIEREPELFKKHMASTLQRIANKAAGTIEKSLDAMAEEGVKPNQVPGLSVALAIMIDKQAALMGDPSVSVVEHRVKVDVSQVRSMISGDEKQRVTREVIDVTPA